MEKLLEYLLPEAIHILLGDTTLNPGKVLNVVKSAIILLEFISIFLTSSDSLGKGPPHIVSLKSFFKLLGPLIG